MPALDRTPETGAPETWRRIAAHTARLGFDMPSEPRTGAFLKMLAATKPGGRMLELGTGTGLATAWLLAGMDAGARLTSVDVAPDLQAVARAELGDDSRVEFVIEDGLAFLQRQPPASYDLIFADAMPGKYEGLEDALALVKPGGIWIGDDMLPQTNWPEGHEARVAGLLETLQGRAGWAVVEMAWASGLVVAVRR
jgi:predicted O-methyltransferase YrrM